MVSAAIHTLGAAASILSRGTYVDVFETVQRRAVDQLGDLFGDQESDT